MTLEDLIYSRLTDSQSLESLLTSYGQKPAVFFQTAPDDKATGWGKKKQYPRIDYVVDYQRNPERKTSGTLTLNIWATEEGTQPEELEPTVRQLLCGVFLLPDDAPPYALAWARSDPFDQQKEGGGIVIGITMTFDVFAFPNQVTTDPDPVLAINRYIKNIVPSAVVIGSSDLQQTTEPTPNQPAFYFRLETIQTQRETNTVAWMDATLAGHVFAGGDETSWLKTVVDALALDGEVTMLDTSPMFIQKLTADNTLDAITAGQLRIFVRFGLLRRKPYAHPLTDRRMNATTNQ